MMCLVRGCGLLKSVFVLVSAASAVGDWSDHRPPPVLRVCEFPRLLDPFTAIVFLRCVSVQSVFSITAIINEVYFSFTMFRDGVRL